jgi:hypothetical protein
VDHEWYRGLITATPSQRNVVEVFYVDYGNSSQVSKSDIRLVRKDFFQLPSQAIKCKLANVTPKMVRKHLKPTTATSGGVVLPKDDL